LPYLISNTAEEAAIECRKHVVINVCGLSLNCEQHQLHPVFIGVIRSIAGEWAGHRERNKALPEYAEVLETHLVEQSALRLSSSPSYGPVLCGFVTHSLLLTP
jgi:hypothetical protein